MSIGANAAIFTVVDAVLKEAGGRSVEELARQENSVLTGLLKLRSQANA